MQKVVACVDGASYTESVCDYAAWAAKRLDIPLHFLHVLVRNADARLDASGIIGLGAQETLLRELAELDERRNTLAREHGELILQGARQHAEHAGARSVGTTQRRGELVETLAEIEPETRLFVMGQHDDEAKPKRLLLDHNLESAIRTLQRPILVANVRFTTPKRFMIAFDGSATALKMVAIVAESPLLQGLQCFVVTVGEASAALDAAAERLASAGFQAKPERLNGEPVQALVEYAQENEIDLLVMGAYGHSRIRHLVVGSTTTAILQRTRIPVFILR